MCHIKKLLIFVCFTKKQIISLHSQNKDKKILRGGAVVARWAHNPKAGGSNPPPATDMSLPLWEALIFYIMYFNPGII